MNVNSVDPRVQICSCIIFDVTVSNFEYFKIIPKLFVRFFEICDYWIKNRYIFYLKYTIIYFILSIPNTKLDRLLPDFKLRQFRQHIWKRSRTCVDLSRKAQNVIGKRGITRRAFEPEKKNKKKKSNGYRKMEDSNRSLAAWKPKGNKKKKMNIIALDRQFKITIRECCPTASNPNKMRISSRVRFLYVIKSQKVYY